MVLGLVSVLVTLISTPFSEVTISSALLVGGVGVTSVLSTTLTASPIPLFSTFPVPSLKLPILNSIPPPPPGASGKGGLGVTMI